MPDPIGWQLERKQRENRREEERAGKARAAESSWDMRGGLGKKMQVEVWARVLEERRETRRR